jgi:hypothetical protein
MNYESLKIPIIENINDIPTIDGDLLHPNGSFYTSRFNYFIETISKRAPLEYSSGFYSFTLDINELNPDNKSTFNDYEIFLNYLKNIRYINYYNLEYGASIEIDLKSDWDFGNFNFEVYFVSEYQIYNIDLRIRKHGSVEGPINISFESVKCPFNLLIEDVGIKYGTFYASKLKFNNCNLLYERNELVFINCDINFNTSTDLIAIDLADSNKKIILKNCIWYQFTNTSLRIDAENSRLLFSLNATNVGNFRLFLKIIGGACYILNGRINYLDLKGLNANLHIVNTHTIINAGVDPNKSFMIDVQNTNLYLTSAILEDNLDSLINLEGSTCYYESTTFTTNAPLNTHLTAKCSRIINRTLSVANRNISSLGTLPTLESAIIYVDGILIGR